MVGDIKRRFFCTIGKPRDSKFLDMVTVFYLIDQTVAMCDNPRDVLVMFPDFSASRTASRDCKPKLYKIRGNLGSVSISLFVIIPTF